MAGAPALAPGPAEAGAAPFADAPRGRWFEVHAQRPGDAVTFVRQRHAGAAFDTRRAKIWIFGSDTHDGDDGIDWTNSPLAFDIGARRWERMYPDDDPKTYRADDRGLAVAGADGDRPWAMHTFGAVEYDDRRDRLVVSSYPAHMKPGRFTDALAHVWGDVRRHPTWVYEIGAGRWRPLPGKPQHFFPFATVFDSDRGVVVGYKGGRFYELSPDDTEWTTVARGGHLGWGCNAVYASRHKAIVVFGDHTEGDGVVVCDVPTRTARTMPKPATPPPGDNYVPLAYSAPADRMLAIVDAPDADRAETWLYDLGANAWTRVDGATLPFRIAMNYNLSFDPRHDVFWLVAAPRGGTPTVRGLRL